MVEEGVRCPVSGAVPPAVIGVVTAGGDHPVVPAELFKADVEPLLAALTARCTAAIEGPPPHAPRQRGFRPHSQERPVVGTAPEQRRRRLSTAAAAVDQQPQPLAAAPVPLRHRVGQVQLLPARRADSLWPAHLRHPIEVLKQVKCALLIRYLPIKKIKFKIK